MMPNESYHDFRAVTIGLREEKNFKVTNSYGTKQGWRWLKKNKWLDIGQPVTERQFGQIIKGVNKILINKFLKGSDLKFPCRMGKLELRKYTPHIELVDGKISTNLPINWKETLKLWHVDKEARLEKKLIRKETDEVFKILYNKHTALYKNKQFMQFTAARGLKKMIKDKADNNELDAFIL